MIPHKKSIAMMRFNTQPPEGGCRDNVPCLPAFACFNTQPPEGGCWILSDSLQKIRKVSTHSRPKAAAHGLIQLKRRRRGFNTQPPEGGCLKRLMNKRKELVFQHTAARRRLHSCGSILLVNSWRFNTQPPEGGCIATNTNLPICNSFNTQPPEGGCIHAGRVRILSLTFQHTAARRRLQGKQIAQSSGRAVSTHSRPKAAASLCCNTQRITKCFNTQPPEGGCSPDPINYFEIAPVSTHSRPKAAASSPNSL